MHSEDLNAHQEGMQEFRAAYEIEPETSPFREHLLSQFLFMERHTAIIRHFGRYPHRNVVLGRESTAEELQFLADGGETFDPRSVKGDAPP